MRKIWLLLLVPFSVFAGNLVENPSFEEGTPVHYSSPLKGWTIRSFKEVFDFHRIDSSSGHTGNRCALIEVPAGNPNANCYFSPAKKIKVEPGRKYKLSLWSKGMAGKAMITGYTAEGKFAGMVGVKQCEIKAGPQWHSTELDYYCPASGNVQLVGVNLCFAGEGAIRFDDIFFEEIGEDKIIAEFYPTSLNKDQTLYPITGEANPLIFHFFSNNRDGEFRLELEVPESFRLLGAVPVYCGKTTKQSFTVSDTRLIIPVDSRVILPLKDFSHHLFQGMALLYSSGAGTCKWQLVQNEKYVTGGVFQIKPLSAKPENLPQVFKLGTWYAPYLTYLSNPQALNDWLAVLKRSDIVSASVSGGEFLDKLDSAGIENQWCFWLTAPDKCLTALLETQILADRIKGIADYTAGKCRNVSCNWNFEPNLSEYYHFCDSCRAAFEKYSGKSTTGLKTGQEVEKKFPREYLAFRSAQLLDIMKLYKKICQENGMQAAVCSLTVPVVKTPETMLHMQRCFGNLKEYATVIDEYLPQIYHIPTLLWDQQEALLDYCPAMTSVVYTSDERGNGQSCSYGLLTPDVLYLETLTAAILGVKKLVFFMGYYTFDGRQVLALRKALGEIAGYENFLYSGQIVPLKAEADKLIRYRLFQHNQSYLLAVVNPSPDAGGTVEFKLNQDKYSILDRLNGTYIVSANGASTFNPQDTVRISIPASSVRFFEIGKNELNSFSPEKMPVKKEIRPRMVINSQGWKVFDDGLGNIIVERGLQKLVLHGNDGAVVSFPGILYEKAGTGGLFRDLFYVPAEARWSADASSYYSSSRPELKQNELIVEFSRELKHPYLQGLIIFKKYLISDDFRKICVEIKIFNSSAAKMEFAYWSHNRPQIIRPKVRTDNSSLDLAATRTVDLYLPAGKSASVEVDGQMSFTWDQNALEKFYFWNGDKYPSIELIGKTVTLPPNGVWNTSLKWEK